MLMAFEGVNAEKGLRGTTESGPTRPPIVSVGVNPQPPERWKMPQTAGVWGRPAPIQKWVGGRDRF
jgi:hypothetical protein